MANGSMLGLVAQKLTLQNLGFGVALTAACAITAQAVMVPTAALAGARADVWGRRPLLLAAFAALALRGALYTLSDHPVWLVGGQLLDGGGAGPVGALVPRAGAAGAGRPPPPARPPRVAGRGAAAGRRGRGADRGALPRGGGRPDARHGPFQR